jgi:hypothetical protein
MTILGIGLTICGLTLVCVSAVFPWIVGRDRSSLESFEESLKRHDHYGVRRAPRDLDADKIRAGRARSRRSLAPRSATCT